MDNQEQVDLLRQGVDVWNVWRKENANARIDLSKANFSDRESNKLFSIDLSNADLNNADLNNADLSNVYLRGADLRGADLRGADLGGANLKGADLKGADLRKTKLECKSLYFGHSTDIDSKWLLVHSLVNEGGVSRKLLEADLEGANLRGVDFSRANLNKANLNGADLSQAILSQADLSQANLSKANLYLADLSRTNLFDADLSYADLILIVGISTNFERALFTGACIQDWNINTETNFDGVVCDYIYLKKNQEERRPLKGNFGPGEFATLVQKSLETIDLIFVDGIDWQAFFQSFQQLRSQFGEQEISIQAIEKKSTAFIVRLEAPPDADKVTIETVQKDLYNTQLQLSEAQGELKVFREMSDVIRTLAGKPMESNQFNFNAPVGNVAGTNQGIQQTTQHNYAPETKQTPAESAKEIQDLLIQLQEDNPTDIQAVVEQRIKTDPTFRQRLQNALKEGGVETLKVLFSPIGIPIEMIRGWIEAEGS